MSSVIEALKSVTAYPIPLRTLVETAEGRGISAQDEMTGELRRTAQYQLAVADLYLWLSLAPDVSQGGQNYSFTDEQRKEFRARAQQLYDEFADDLNPAPKPRYGYKGSKL